MVCCDELQSIYQEQCLSRDELKVLSENQMSEIAKRIQYSSFTNKNLEKMIMTLHTQLRSVSGKKVYGYLPKEIKETVDKIFSEIAKTPQIKAMYEKWCELERAKYKTYTQKEKDIPTLKQNKVFQPVRNMIIRTVMQMKFPTSDIEIEMPEPTEIDLDIPMNINGYFEFKKISMVSSLTLLVVAFLIMLSKLTERRYSDEKGC